MKRTLLILFIMCSCFHVFSQIDRCATDKMVQQELLLNPDKKLLLEQLELFTQDFIRNSRLEDTTYIIPVVVHVIHDYGDERIDEEQVASAIASMCEDFSRTNDDLIDENGNFTHSVSNGTDTVYVTAQGLTENAEIDWHFTDNQSIKKNDTICTLINNNESIPIIVDDPGNTRFCGGLINTVSNNNLVTNGDVIAKIITTEARGFEDIVADIGIEFRLATKDPDGNCTTGITYHHSTLTYIGGENVKDDTYWPNDKYLNIWTVANVASGAAAYAYYPGSAPRNHEGILCQHDYFGTTGTSSNGNWQRHTMAHEAGHYFNLAHPWGSTNDPSVEENCNSDDYVEDTPNTIGASGCFSYDSQISCGSLDNVANIMDYTNCAYMFSKGQKQRVIAALNSTSGDRNNLWTQENLELTGTDDNHFFIEPYAECKPIADFQVIGSEIGALGTDNGFDVSFQDMSYNVPAESISYEWFFPGATPSMSTEKNPTVTYNISGQHDVTLIVSNNNGSSELIKEKCIIILDRAVAPFIEDFESSLFPISDHSDRPSWYILDNYPSETNWQKFDQSGYEGNQSLRIRSKSFTAGLDINQQIYSPELDCSNQPSSNPAWESSINPNGIFGVYFHIAYAKRLPYEDVEGTSIIPDKLIVSRKHSNSSNWMVRETFNIDELITNQQTYFNEYVPNEGDWQEKWVNLGSSAGQESVIVRFEFTGQGYLTNDTIININGGGEYTSNNIGGNWLYIDNFRIGNVNNEETLDAIENLESDNDNRIFDLVGREYSSRVGLKTGVYIQNRKLFFIRKNH